MKLKTKELVLLLSFLMICAVTLVPRAKADPEPENVCWLVLDPITFEPINDAWLTIYYSASVGGPYNVVPAYDPVTQWHVYDKIADTNQNPIISGYWNPDHVDGLANADLHVTGISGYYFYVKIEKPLGTLIDYWPKADSIKPTHPEWGLVPPNTEGFVSAPGIGAGYVAMGNGLGNGPTTAYPTEIPPPPVIPEVPFGTIVSFLSMFIVLGGFVGIRRFRPKLH